MSGGMPTLFFLNRFYWPDEPATAQLLGDLAEALAARGWPVSVIASHPGDAQTPAVEIRNGVKVYRRRGPRWGRTAVGGKLVDYLCYLLGAGWQTLLSLRRGDVVVAMTDPPLLGVVLWPIVALRRARLVHWAQDIYPEVAMALAPRPAVRGMLGWLRGPRNFTWRHSAGCVTLGREMSGLIMRNGIAPDRVAVVPNWAPRGLGPPPPQAVQHQRSEWHLAGKFAVVYSGNLGRVHDLEPVLEVAAALRDAPDIVFLFVGTGPRHGALAAQAQARGLSNVFFFPPQPRAQLGATLAAGDLHLVTLRPGCQTVVFPSKLYGIAAVARPLVFIGPRECELAALVRDHTLGFAFARDDTAAIAACLRRLSTAPDECRALGAAAGEFHRREGGLARAVTVWERILADGAAQPPANKRDDA
jgi:colanic acid biosynthesis glycosyl transferase WcaI